MLFTAPVKCLTYEEAIQMYDRAIQFNSYKLNNIK